MECWPIRLQDKARDRDLRHRAGCVKDISPVHDLLPERVETEIPSGKVYKKIHPEVNFHNGKEALWALSACS